jgi:hypothetical protein
MYITAARNAADAQAGNPRANQEADEVRALFARDAALSDAYNHTLLGGKWDHMMDQTHLGYTSWRDPPVNVMPAVSWIQVPKEGSLGVDAEAAEGESKPPVSLGTIDSVSNQDRTLLLFDRGRDPVTYTIAASAPWLVPSSTTGTVGATGRQVLLHVDWSKLPAAADSADGTVTVTSDNARPLTYVLHALRLPITRENAKGFVESDGYVAMEAADTSSRTTDGAGPNAMHWVALPDYGQARSAMTVFPVTAASRTDSAASLQYTMYLYDSGNLQLQLTLAPTLNFVPGRGLRFAVSVDDGPRTIVDALEHNTKDDWAKAVSDGVRRVTVPLTVTAPGYHTLKIWAVDPALVVERLVLSRGVLRPSYLGPPESFHPQQARSL